MNEEFLAYVWRYRLLSPSLHTTDHEPLEVLFPGDLNPDAGPDFANARLRIGPTLWAGNVEIHVKASDWYKHGHHTDPAYRNTVLHVVHDDDLAGTPASISGLPVLVLKGHFDENLYDHYRNFMSCRAWIACAGQLRDADPFRTIHWLEGRAIERLERKTLSLRTVLERNEWNWEQSFFEITARAFGARVNADAFERLARSVPLKIIGEQRADLTRLEALLFGQSGMLRGRAGDAYQRELQTIYKEQKKSYRLENLPEGSFRFLRLRPPNFPSLRIAQLATLLYQTPGLFSRALQCQSTPELFKLFSAGCSAYWERHYRFGKSAPTHQGHIGQDSINLILVNAVIPFLFVYGTEKESPDIRDQAFQFLLRLPPEENSIVKNYRSAGLAVSNAMGSQALLELKSKYCDARRCLECGIGHNLFTT